jgi:hypothetical protein
VVLLDRGECTFYTKFLNAAAAGAVGVILADNTHHGALPMLVRGQPDIDPTETENPIPIVAVKRGARDDMSHLLNKGPVQAEISFGTSGGGIASVKKGRSKLAWFRGVPPARLCKPDEWVSAEALSGVSRPRPFTYIDQNDDEASSVRTQIISRYQSPVITAKGEVYEMESVDWDMTAFPYESACVLSIPDACIHKKGATYDDFAVYEFPFNNREFSLKAYETISKPIYPDQFVSCRNARSGEGQQHFDRIFSFAEIWADAFSHSIFQSLPQVQIAYEKMTEFPESKVLVPEQGPLKSLLLALGVDEKRIIHPGKLYTAKCVHIVAYRSTEANVYQPQLALQPHGLLQPIASKLAGGPLSKPPTQDLVLYLKRSGSETLGEQRALINEDELLEQVRAQLKPGFELKVFETVGYEDDEATVAWKTDQEVFRRAKAVFGPHGGAFANIIFAQKETAIVEFNTLQQHVWRPQYYGLSQMAGLDYTVVEALRTHSHERNAVEGDDVAATNSLFYRVPMTVPVQGVLEALANAGVVFRSDDAGKKEL